MSFMSKGIRGKAIDLQDCLTCVVLGGGSATKRGSESAMICTRKGGDDIKNMWSLETGEQDKRPRE